ncbi:MAG: hypothetical protein COX57_03080 [Alphaproteobacteria bacterium CG_4_10_14_0_2_um_filter_63_37]|nr:MAG: hypothetical protein COX57_03080 [Alphaproteobacteria bacterium CG_4_10_14_0_2_um_filter_63_37]
MFMIDVHLLDPADDCLSWLAAQIDAHAGELGLLPDDGKYLFIAMLNHAHFSTDSHRPLVAQVDGVNAGLALVFKPPKKGGIHKLAALYVLPQYRGMGVGALLLQRALGLGSKSEPTVVAATPAAAAYYHNRGLIADAICPDGSINMVQRKLTPRQTAIGSYELFATGRQIVAMCPEGQREGLWQAVGNELARFAWPEVETPLAG